MIQWVGIDQLAQHVTVAIVAIGALGVVLKRVFGVFDNRRAGSAEATTGVAAGPACNHCAAGHAVAKKHSHP